MRVKRRRRDVEVFRFEVEGEQILVVSLPSARVEVDGLSAAEREVALDAARGLSNRAIARRRQRSERTVANQLASAFRKLNVYSRAELAARFAGKHAE